MIPEVKLTVLNVLEPKDVLLLISVKGPALGAPGTSMIISALLIPVTLPVADIRPAVEELFTRSASCGAPPAWKSIPAPAAEVVSVLSCMSSLPLVTTIRWDEPPKVILLPSITLSLVLSIVQLPIGGEPPLWVTVCLLEPLKRIVVVPPLAPVPIL